MTVTRSGPSTEADKIREIISEGYDTHKGFTIIKGEDSRSLESQLKRLEDAKVHCVYFNGVNKSSFKDCCGNNYDKIEKEFLDFYELIVQDFIRDFELGMYDVCDVEVTPCRQMNQQLRLALERNVDPYNFLVLAAGKVSHPEAMNDERLHEHLIDLKHEYQLLLNSRNLIAGTALSTINRIREYLRDSKIPFAIRSGRYDPTRFYAKLGLVYVVVEKNMSLEQQTINEDIDEPDLQIDEIEQEEAERQEEGLDEEGVSVGPQVAITGDPFFDELLNNSGSRNLVNYYLLNSSVDRNKLDMSLMPNQILRHIQDQLREKKEKKDKERKI